MNSQPIVDLSTVTLCAADSIHPALAARALDISAARCTFADAILFTHEPITARSARTVPIPRLQSKHDYSAFMVKHLVNHIATPWVLVTQWDGYVLDAAAWSDTFFSYDYIGASWPFYTDGMNMGNGGFSLRSKKLLQALTDERIELLPGVAEDVLICRAYRLLLEAEHGIRFAPAGIAAQFAYEHVVPDSPTFGFHAAFNMWRHVDDDTMMDIVGTLDVRTFTSNEVMQLLMFYCEHRKFTCMKVMYERYRHLWSRQEVVQNMTATGISGEAVLRYVDLCEKLLADHRGGPRA